MLKSAKSGSFNMLLKKKEKKRIARTKKSYDSAEGSAALPHTTLYFGETESLSVSNKIQTETKPFA
jgi:hypothetical protein